MIEYLGVLLLIILFVPLLKAGKYREIERQQALRRAANKLQAKQRHSGV